MIKTLEQRISVITLGVENIKESRRFYEGLGWRASPKSNDEVVFFQMNGLIMALWGRKDLAKDSLLQDKKVENYAGVALAYNVRAKSEVAEILELAQKLGGEIRRQAEDVSWGGHNGYFSDPDGHLWEIAYNPFWSIDEQGNIGMGDG